LRRGALVASAALAAALLSAGRARAQEPDGLYGRFDGDLDLRAHAGVALAGGGPAMAAQLSLVYLATAGVYAHYTDALGSGAPFVARSLAAGLHISPLFLARYASGRERGPAFVDLAIDSLAFEMGAFWAAPNRSEWDEHPGLEVALDAGLPLFAHATGLFLGVRGALRWRPSDFIAGAPGGLADRGAVLSLTLGWHQVLRTHLVDAGDGVLP
jgi:hypothetical protein